MHTNEIFYTLIYYNNHVNSGIKLHVISVHQPKRGIRNVGGENMRGVAVEGGKGVRREEGEMQRVERTR